MCLKFKYRKLLGIWTRWKTFLIQREIINKLQNKYRLVESKENHEDDFKVKYLDKKRNK